MHARNRTWLLGSDPAERCRQRTMPVEGGDGSTLSLDFTTGVLDTRLTFTRSSTGTFINASGLVATASNNVARFDHDPATLAPRGLLIEASATNLVTQSEAFTTGAGNWTDSNITRDGTLRTSPDGTANALRITASAGNATIIRTSAIGTSAARTFSIWLRRVTGTGNIDYTQDNGANWNTQAITSSWVRYTFTHTANHQVGIRIVTIDDAIELWGAQLETGSGASSYIPTGASQGTRNADHCTMPTSSFITGPLYPQTLFVECIPATPSTAFPDIVRLFDRTAGGTFNYGNEIYYFSAATMSVQRKINSSSGTDRALASGLTYNTRHKFATAIDSSSFIGSYDGLTGSGATTAAAALASQVTHLGVGCNGDATPISVMFGTVRQIKFYPFAMAQSQLNALTTL
jgi:hypothetical protein